MSDCEAGDGDRRLGKLQLRTADIELNSQSFGGKQLSERQFAVLLGGVPMPQI